jgi:hypothetical protein
MIKTIFKMPECRPIYLDGYLVVGVIVKQDEHGSYTCWTLPGRIETHDFDAVRDYVSWIKREKLHIKGKVEV